MTGTTVSPLIHGVVAQARAAFATYQAALQAIQSNQTAVEANTLALEGTRAEQSVGTRNVLDVLNAEQELLNSQVALVSARRDIGAEEDNPRALAWRNAAYRHIDGAMEELPRAARDLRLDHLEGY